jgi:dCTP deaminase
MILSDHGINEAIAKGELEIDPKPREEQYTTSAVDLFIGSSFRCWDQEKLKIKGLTSTLNLSEQEFLVTANAYLIPMKLESDGSFLFPPYEQKRMHVLGITQERVHLKPGSRLAGRVEGRSSLARIGLTVHLTAPTIHTGFNGQITLEMINYSPFTLKLIPASTRICQLIFERLESPPSREIQTTFQHQTEPSGRH